LQGGPPLRARDVGRLKAQRLGLFLHVLRESVVAQKDLLAQRRGPERS
jgi:hypothetical protein